jgi:hypothetical protein
MQKFLLEISFNSQKSVCHGGEIHEKKNRPSRIVQKGKQKMFDQRHTKKLFENIERCIFPASKFMLL